MVNPSRHLFRFTLKPMLQRSLLIGALSLAGIVSGLVPTFQSTSSAPVFSNSAYAQAAVTDQEVQNYARSVLEIEPIRQEAYDEIKQRIGSGTVPSISCHRPNSLNNLRREIRQIAVQYCNDSISIVERHNLTITRFNTITTSLQGDQALTDRVQQELLRLQQPQNSARP